ncbi:MAG: cation:proton antiporter [Nanoarchaeota archaeon]|nr:cation:proton antiporter [Nanoarchaeota archaeon]
MAKLHTWILMGLLLATLVFAAEEGAANAQSIGSAFFWIAIILIAARVSSLVERFGQPSVLGELVMGVILGNLVLLGVSWFEPLKTDMFIPFLAELGVVILLFQVGLESSIAGMKKVGLRAFLVACVGVALPFFLGTFLGPYLLPGLSSNAYLFLGATLTATSVGITARVFKDLNKLSIPEAQIVLGAAVIDDVIGLVILAVVSAIVTSGSVGLGVVTWITLKALLFLVGAIVLGGFLAPRLGKLFSKIHTGVGMKFTLAISFCLLFAYAASLIGLAPIVGAFAAGLVLRPVHFKEFEEPEIGRYVKEHLTPGNAQGNILKLLDEHAEKHVEHLIQPLGHFLIPIFFVMTGLHVKLETLFNLPILLTALGVAAVAIFGKVATGLVAGKVDKWLVGWGMVPRGEVGLIFAAIGKSLGVVNDTVYSIIIIVVILTTLLPPPILAWLIRRKAAHQ